MKDRDVDSASYDTQYATNVQYSPYYMDYEDQSNLNVFKNAIDNLFYKPPLRPYVRIKEPGQ